MTPAAVGETRRGRSRVAEIARFGIVGATSTIAYLAIYAAAVLTGIPFVAATLIAFVLSAGCGYVLHDRFTFRTNTPSRPGLARWLILQGAVLALNIVALWTLVEQAGMNPLLAQVLLLPLLPLTTYLLSRRRVFGAP